MKEFLTKKFGGLPVWAWALIGVAGVGAGYLLIKWQQGKSNTPSALTANSTPSLTTGNASGNETNSAMGTVGSNGVIDNPFPESNVNGQQIPVIPPGYQAVFDGNGNIIGWGPTPTNPTPTQPNQPTTPSQPSKPIQPYSPVSPSVPGPPPGITPSAPVTPLVPSSRYVHPAAWPAATSTLSGIASANGDTLQQVEGLNPSIYAQRRTWNLIYPSDNIRVA